MTFKLAEDKNFVGHKKCRMKNWKEKKKKKKKVAHHGLLSGKDSLKSLLEDRASSQPSSLANLDTFLNTT